MKGMIQFILDDKSRTALLEAVHPKHEVVVAHHVTIAFKPEAGNPVLGQFRNGEELTIKAIGHAEDELIQAVSVRIFSTNEHPHITISHTYDTGPVYSNELLQTVPVIPFEEPLELTGRIKMEYPTCIKCGKQKVYQDERFHIQCVKEGFFNNEWCYVCNENSEASQEARCKHDDMLESYRVWCGDDSCEEACTNCPEFICRSKDIKVKEWYDKDQEAQAVARREESERLEKERNEEICRREGCNWNWNSNFPGSWCSRCGNTRSWQ